MSLNQLREEVGKKLLSRKSDKIARPKFDFKIEKSMFNIQKSIQDLPNFNHAQYIASVGPHHYLVSGLGGPVTLISQYST